MAGNLNTSLDIGVLGLNAHASAMGMISDNVANVNTVGYKQVSNQFRTVFQDTDARSGFLTGGVNSVPLQEVSMQGLIRDDAGYASMAISGAGMFVATDIATPENESNFVYTRAGQFAPDANGNLVNTGGYFLQGWPWDPETQSIPGTEETRRTDINLMETVNIANLSGAARATENVSVRINLDGRQDAQQTVSLYEGSRAVATTQVDTVNMLITAGTPDQTISSPSFANQAILVGDTIEIPSSVTNPGPFTVTAFNQSTGTITVAEPVTDEIFAAVTPVNLTNPNPLPQGTGITGAAGATFTTAPPQMVAADLIGASIAVGDYIAVRGPFTNRVNDATYKVDAFDPATGTVTFTNAPASATTIPTLDFDILKPDNPALLQDEFASISGPSSFFAIGSTFQSLAAANRNFLIGDQIEIQTTSGTNDGFWTVEGYDSTQGAITLRSLDGSQTLGGEVLSNNEVTLFRHIPARTGLGGVTDPTLTANQVTEYRTIAGGGMIPDFSRSISVFDGQGVEHDLNLSFVKGNTANQWYVEVSSLNAFQGTAGSTTEEHHPNGIISFGLVQFNPDGTINTQQSSMYVPTFDAAGTPPITYNLSTLEAAQNFDIVWDPSKTGAAGSLTSGLNAQTLESIDFGTDGDNDGITQYGGASVMYSNVVDGAIFGRFTGVSVDEEGWMLANYNNGLSERIYKLPLADVPNASGLTSLAGNAYQASISSGAVTFNDPADNKGDIRFRSLEQSTVNLAEQFTDMIVIQRAYSAASRLITTADEMLQEATRLK